MSNNRLDNTRVVVFSEDYKDANGNIVFAAGQKHYIHHKTVAKLKLKGAKFKAENFPEKEEIEKAKKVLRESRKKQKDVE